MQAVRDRQSAVPRGRCSLRKHLGTIVCRQNIDESDIQHRPTRPAQRHEPWRPLQQIIRIVSFRGDAHEQRIVYEGAAGEEGHVRL